MSIGDRIKYLRKELGLTQSEFAEKISLKQAAIGLYENGKRNVVDRVIADICREFNVNETWLKDGQGKTFVELSRDEQVANIVGKLLASEDESIKNIMIALGKMGPKEWKKAQEIIDILKSE